MELRKAQLDNGAKSQQLAEEKGKVANLEKELELEQAEVAQLRPQLRAREEEVAGHERRIREEEEAKAAAAAREGPPPATPEEVKREMLKAFEEAANAVCKEIAADSGAATVGDDEDRIVEVGDDDEMATGEEGGASSSTSFVAGKDGLDAEAMIDAGVPVVTMAEQYLRAVCERVSAVEQRAREEVITKWRNELGKRRALQDELQEIKGSIRVMCRVRPAGRDEGESAVTTFSDTDVAITMNPGKDGRKSFTFDCVFGPESHQAAVFEEVEPVLDSVLGGFNVCIFAYGQTGSGKTFTMEGAKRDGEDSLVGINPRALRRLFQLIKDKQQLAAMGGKAAGRNAEDGWTYEVNVSYLEIYNEVLRDLLSAGTESTQGRETRGGNKRPSQTLEIRHAAGSAVQVPGLTTVACRSANEVEAALQRGAGRRSVRATESNSESSRSHSIVMVTVSGKNSITGASTHGKLHLVDLAGSERVKKSEVSGQGMAEACNINKSLSALGDVMAALQEKSKHIPFRNSKLTQLLADSLGGNSKTFMFVNVNPVVPAAAETLCSLNFAARVRRVELGKASAKGSSGASLQELKAAKEVGERANEELGKTQQRMEALEKEVQLSAGAASA